MDLRKLRYFVAVARHLHFGRAAAELHIAQPVLSRQIRALEGELRVELFRRDRRSTELTEAGHRLLAGAGPLLAAAEALRRRVAAPDRFVVAFMPGLLVTGAVRRLRDRHPGLAVEVLRTTWSDQVEVLRDGRADVSYLRLPADRRGLTVRPLTSEPRVVVLPVGHRLAGKDSVAIADLAAETLLQNPEAVPEWGEAATAPVPAHSVEEKLEYVAAGRGIVVLPLSTATYYTRPDVTWSRITDIPDNQVVLAWLSERRDALLTEYAELAL
ncbi:LysR family transcriptional regulator [Paractinoplanes atraurantiacus]|uniref:DNA-binding transcriptional regulator, LysR family n=1 Tax=Paractinoplanes atraurantiacus TaxID=1036182 RepID=A0A285HNE5_9ACTN|nr:LysR substrate-binding domain-containing protein [Actinoplanes atraurantiacus]SNY37245.1 DNA-binding transcriptional regulator, LysR family [Actinoplanes atraurantiacus]